MLLIQEGFFFSHKLSFLFYRSSFRALSLLPCSKVIIHFNGFKMDINSFILMLTQHFLWGHFEHLQLWIKGESDFELPKDRIRTRKAWRRWKCIALLEPTRAAGRPLAFLKAQQCLSPHYDQGDKLFCRRQGGYVGVCTCVGARMRVDMCVWEGRNRPQTN